MYLKPVRTKATRFHYYLKVIGFNDALGKGRGWKTQGRLFSWGKNEPAAQLGQLTFGLEQGLAAS